MAVVLKIIKTRQIGINVHKRNNEIVQTIENTVITSTHITKTPHIHTPTHTHTHTLQDPHIHTPTHHKTHTYTHQHINQRLFVLNISINSG